MLPLPVVSTNTRPEESSTAASAMEVLRLDAQRELSRLDREQLAQLAAVLLEAMPSSYQWSVVASIRGAQQRYRPVGPIPLQKQ